MIKLIALLSLSVLTLLVTIGNFWFTYHLWPQSWLSFVFFGFANATVLACIEIVRKSP